MPCYECCAAIGCLSRHSVDALHSPCPTAMCDGLNGQNTTVGSGLSGTSALGVAAGLPLMSENPHSAVSTAGLSQLGQSSSLIRPQLLHCDSDLTQYPLSESLVSADETAVNSQIMCADMDTAQLSQYTLCDNSSDALLHAGEPVSLMQFPLSDSSDNISVSSHRETDGVAVMNKDGYKSRELDVQHSCNHDQQSAVHSGLMPLSADDANAVVGSCVARYCADVAVMDIFRSHQSGDQGICGGDADLMPFSSSAGSSVACCLSTASQTSDKLTESNNKWLPLHVISSISLRAVSDHPAGMNNPVSPIVATFYPQIASCSDQDDTVAVSESKTLLTEAIVAADSQSTQSLVTVASVTVKPLPAASAILEGLASDSEQSPSSACVEMSCSSQLGALTNAAAVDDGDNTLLVTSLRVPSDHKAESKPATVATNKEQSKSQLTQLTPETENNSSAEIHRNMVDGFELSDKLSSSVTVRNITENDSNGTADHKAGHVSCTGSDNVQTKISAHSCTFVQSSNVSESGQSSAVVNDINRDKTDIFSDVESQQHLTMMSQKPSDVIDHDLAVPLEQDSGSEVDDDALGDNVRMILAKYRLTRCAPIGSDSMPVASIAKTDNELVVNAAAHLQTDHHTHSGTTRDVDTCSSSSDDMLATQVKALLLSDKHASNSRSSPPTASNATSQCISQVSSVCSGQSATVDYSSLSRDLNNIQMNLDSMRNSAQSSFSQHDSAHSRVADESTKLELLNVHVQNKTSLAQLLEQSLFGHAGEGVRTDNMSKAEAASSADNHVSLPGTVALARRVASVVEDTESSIGLQSHQHRYVAGMVTVEDIQLDAASEVSSLHNETRELGSSNLDDCRSVADQVTSVEAAVKQFEHNLSRVIQRDRHDTSLTSSGNEYRMNEDKLFKHSSSESGVNQQMLALSDDEYYVSGTGLSRGYSDSCSMSSEAIQSQFNQSASHSKNMRALPLSYPGDITGLNVSDSTQIVSAAHLQFTQLPYEVDSSVSGSYDSENEPPLTDRHSCDGDGELRSNGGGGGIPQLPVDQSLDGCDVAVSVSCMDAAVASTSGASQSHTNVYVLQPYQ